MAEEAQRVVCSQCGAPQPRYEVLPRVDESFQEWMARLEQLVKTEEASDVSPSMD